VPQPAPTLALVLAGIPVLRLERFNQLWLTHASRLVERRQKAEGEEWEGLPTELSEINSPRMTKTELQIALAEATQTNRKTAGVFLDTLSSIATKLPKRTANSSSNPAPICPPYLYKKIVVM
jgi:hypothetical protein